MTSPSDSAAPLTLRDYVTVMRRRRWILLALALLVPAVLLAAARLEPRSYTGTAEVLLSKGSQTQGGAPGAERTTKTQAQLAATPAVAAAALRELKIADRSVNDLLQASSVMVTPDADILTFVVTDRSARLATALATAYAHAYTLYRRQLDAAALQRAQANVKKGIERLRARRQSGDPLFTALLRKEQALKLDDATRPDAAVLVAPAASPVASGPRLVRRAFIGLGVGAILGLLLAFTAEALDTRVRSAGEIARILHAPLLARLPRPPRHLRRHNGLVMLDDPYGGQAEAFRVLRTNLEFFNLERGARTLMVTSAGRREGKSTTVANLAIALGRAGRRVVLVDLDLRGPVLDRIFTVPSPGPGLSEVARGSAFIEEALVEVPLGGPYGTEETWTGWTDEPATAGRVELMPTGADVPNVGEFVESASLARVLSELKQRADIVLIDGPPLLGAGDGITLSARVDALVIVARLNELRRPMVEEFARLLARAPAAKLGFAVTSAEYDGGYVSDPAGTARPYIEARTG